MPSVLTCDENLDVFCFYAFQYGSDDATRCVANALYHNQGAACIDWARWGSLIADRFDGVCLIYAEAAASNTSQTSREMGASFFYISRALFLATVDSEQAGLFHAHGLPAVLRRTREVSEAVTASAIINRAKQLLGALQDRTLSSLTSMERMAYNDVLKLLFNVSVFVEPDW